MQENKQDISEIGKSKLKDTIIEETEKMADLPFGSEILNASNLPDNWSNIENADTLKQHSYNIVINGLQREYDKINRGANIKYDSLASLTKTEIELKYPISFNCSKYNEFPSKGIRLPNVGPYYCYYLYSNASQITDTTQNKIDFENEELKCREMGNLILWNKQTKIASVINIYLTVDGPFSGYCRYFYISKNMSIKIYELEADELESRLYMSYDISIKKDGQVLVKRHASEASFQSK